MKRTKVTNTTKITTNRIIKILTFSLFFGAFLLYAFIHHQKHRQFLTFGWDLAVFDQPVYLFSSGQTPFSSLHNTHTFGDHFHPLVLLVGGLLYKIWADPRMLLWLESAIAVASGLALYHLASHHLANLARILLTRGHQTISSLLPLALTAMYLFSVGFQAMVLDDFHDDVLITLPLVLLFLFLHRRHWLGYWLSVIWILLTKEEFGLLVAAIGFLVILKHKLFKLGLITIAIGVASFFLLLNVIIPKFSSGTYWQYSYRHYSDTNRPSVVLRRFINQPQLLITTLLDHPQKRRTLLATTVSFAGLPLLAPVYLFPAWETLMIRFVDATAPLRFEFNNHYNGPLIALLAIASIYGARRALKLISPSLLTGIILVITLFQNWLFHGPINSIFKPKFYQLADWQKDAHELVTQVPRSGSLATQNFLLPHLSQRPQFCLLPDTCHALYIAVVLNHTSPDFYGPPPDQLKSQLDQLIATNQYRIVWQLNQALLLERVK